MHNLQRYFIVISLVICSLELAGQIKIYSDEGLKQEIRENIDSLYNYNFDALDEDYNLYNNKFPDYPFPDLYYTLGLYWKYFPITPSSPFEKTYLKKLKNAIRTSEKILKKRGDDTEMSFFHLMSRLFIMQYYADNGMSSEVVSHIKPAYKMITSGFDYTNQLVDFHFTTGVYNYYREYYPQKYPMYKPVAFFLPDGNATEGLNQLKYNWQHGVFLHAESLFFLTYIYFYFERNYSEALFYSNHLIRDYPRNWLYRIYHIQILLMLKKYDEAQVHIEILEQNRHSNDFYHLAARLYRGILAEKTERNYYKAAQFYQEVLSGFGKYGDFTNSYKSVAYFGLSRIYKDSNKKLSKDYRKKAEHLSVFSHITFD